MTTSDSLLSPALTASPLSGAMTFSTPPSGFIAPAHASYGSCSSWGTAPSSGHPPSQSHPGAWTSERSKSPLSVHMSPPAGLASVPPSYYASPSWGSQASTLQGSWGSPPSVANSSVPASHHGSVASIATASSLTLVNVPVGVRGQSALPRSDVYPANLTGLPPSPIHIHLALQDARRLDIDMAGPPPSLGSNHSLSDSAFCPSMTYMDVEFDDGFPPLRLCDGGLTVFTVVSQIWNYMQAKDLSGGQCMQQLPTSRDHAASPSSFHRGARRVDRLGHRTKLVGFRPSKIAGHNRWKAIFSA